MSVRVIHDPAEAALVKEQARREFETACRDAQIEMPSSFLDKWWPGTG